MCRPLSRSPTSRERRPSVAEPSRVRHASQMDRPAEARAEAAAAALAPTLGPVEVRLTERLPGGDRAVVFRALAVGPQGEQHAVVLKAPTGMGGGSAREEAALRLAAKHRLSGIVRLLGSSIDPPLLVLADLGRGPTLADRLLGDDPEAARAGVLRWAATVGSVQAATAALGPAFAAELAAVSPLGAPPVDTTRDTLAEAAVALARDLPRMGVAVPAAALAELRGVADALDGSRAGAPAGLVPGDTCPSNAVETDTGIVLLDFEAAEHRHVAWEAAYLCVPWPSCWCSWRLPEEVTAQALQAWRQAAAPGAPAVLTPDFQDDLARATIAWVFISASWFLPAALDGDPPPPDPARRAIVPTRRALLQHRLRVAADLDTGALPALRDLADQAHQATVSQWGRRPLQLAAAFH